MKVSWLKLGMAAVIFGCLGTTAWADGDGFWARLSVPFDGQEEQECHVVYGNGGGVDLKAPILQVTADKGGMVGFSDRDEFQEIIQFIAAGTTEQAGVLHPGEEGQVSFRFRPGDNGSVSVRSSEGTEWFHAPWNSATDMREGISVAATRIALRGGDATDYAKVHTLAQSVRNGENTSVIYGRVLDADENGVEGVVVSFSDTNSVVAASAMTGKTGHFVSTILQVGKYDISFFSGTQVDWPESITIDGTKDIDLGVMVVSNTISGIVKIVGPVPSGTIVQASSLEGMVVAQAQWSDTSTAIFHDLPEGWYHIEATDGNIAAEDVLCVGADSVQEIELALFQTGTISGTIADFDDPLELGIMIVGRNGIVRVAYADEKGKFSVSGIPPGAYSVQVVGKGAEVYEATDEIELVAGGSHTLSFEPTKMKMTSTVIKERHTYVALSRSSDYEPGSNLWFWHYIGIRDDLKEAIGKGRDALNSTGVFKPWSCECEHNLAKYDSDVATYNKLERIVVRMEALWKRADRSYFAPIWKNGFEAIANTVRSAKEFQLMYYSAFDLNTKVELMDYVDKAATVVTYFEELDYDTGGYAEQTATFIKKQLIPGMQKIAKDYDKLCSRGISGVWAALSECIDSDSFNPLINYIDSLTDLYEEAGKVANLAEKGASFGAYFAPEYAAELEVLKTMAKTYKALTAYVQPAISYLKAVADLLRTQQAFDDGYTGWMDDSRVIEVALSHFETAYSDFITKSKSFNDYHDPCPDDGIDIPLFDDVEDVAETIEEEEPEGRKQDVVLVIDSTGSMSDAISSVKVAARQIVHKILGETGATTGNRVAVVEYRDKDDVFVYRARSLFTTDATSAVSAINGISVAGGGDTPEALYATLRAVAGGLAGAWGAAERHIIVMTDAPPHDPDKVSGDTRASIAALLNAKNIRTSSRGTVRSPRDADEPDGVFHVHVVYLECSSSVMGAYQDLTESTGGTLQSCVNPNEAAEAILDALEVIEEGGTKTAEAEIGWKFLKATGTYFAQLRVAFPDGGWEDAAGLRYLFADRIGADGKTAAGLWSSKNRAALATTEVYGGETYRSVTLDSTALAAGGGEAVYGVQNLGADGIPVAERGIEMYVRKRVSPDGGNESVAGVEDFVGYVAWEAGGESHAVPVAAGIAPEELSALRNVAIGTRGLSVPIAASTLNRSLAVGVALDDGAEPYCTVASYQTESGRMYGTVEVGATKAGRMRRGALGANATVTLLGAETAAGPYEALGAAEVGQDGTFEMDVPEGAAFFRFRIDVADTVK